MDSISKTLFKSVCAVQRNICSDLIFLCHTPVLCGRVLRTDGRLEDAGDFSDFYIQPSEDMDPMEMKELRELQDEELARLLQDQEKKVSG